MSKPLFFTGRKEISKMDVEIRLIESRGKTSQFETRIDLASYDLPGDAGVIVEAYHNTYLERFEIGTVGTLKDGQRQELQGLEPGDRPHFRVKVVDSNGGVSGRLLAAIDEVRAETEDDFGAAASLLPLVPKQRGQMGDEFWRVMFVWADEPHPELWVNADVEGLFRAIKNHDPRITALIMPDVFRQVLRGLVGNAQPWTEEGKTGQWLALCKQFYPDEFEEWEDATPDASRQRRHEWIDEVVSQFASSHGFFDRYHDALRQQTEGGTSND